jgi:DNA-binding transcriptional MerR regulator
MLRSGQAAALLGVSPHVLTAWEQQFGYPKPARLDDDRPLYSHKELIALRDALETSLSIPSAIRKAQNALSAEDRSQTTQRPQRSASTEVRCRVR